jgi:hypothetical protein
LFGKLKDIDFGFVTWQIGRYWFGFVARQIKWVLIWLYSTFCQIKKDWLLVMGLSILGLLFNELEGIGLVLLLGESKGINFVLLFNKSNGPNLVSLLAN